MAKKPKVTATSKLLGLKHKVQISTYLTHSQAAALDALSEQTGKPKTVLIRQAIDKLLGAKS